MVCLPPFSVHNPSLISTFSGANFYWTKPTLSDLPTSWPNLTRWPRSLLESRWPSEAYYRFPIFGRQAESSPSKWFILFQRAPPYPSGRWELVLPHKRSPWLWPQKGESSFIEDEDLKKGLSWFKMCPYFLSPPPFYGEIKICSAQRWGHYIPTLPIHTVKEYFYK